MMWRKTMILGLALMAGVGPATAAEVRILATGVFATTLRDLAEPFKAASGHDLRLTIANAGVIAAKVEAEEPADLVMTSSKGIDALARKGKVVAASKADIGLMRLGLGVRADAPRPNIASPDQLRALLLAAPAIAYIDPKGGATAGAFFERIFEQLGIAQAVHAKAVLCGDGADVDAALAASKVTVGMTQASEIIGARDVAFVGFLPDPLNGTTVYAAALTAKPMAADAARAFLAFLQGPIGQARLQQAGWAPIKPNP